MCASFDRRALDSGVKIAYDFFEPAKVRYSKDAPIIHGLFGRRGTTEHEYAQPARSHATRAYILPEVRELNRSVHAIVICANYGDRRIILNTTTLLSPRTGRLPQKKNIKGQHADRDSMGKDG